MKDWANSPRQRVIGWTDEAALEIKAAQCFHLQAALQIWFHCHFKTFAKQTNLKWVKRPPLGLQSLRDMRAAKLIIQRIKLDVKYSKHGIKESNGDMKGSRQSQAASLGRSGLIVTRSEAAEAGVLRGLSVRQFNPVFQRKQTDGSLRMTALTFQSLRDGKRKGRETSGQNLETYHIHLPFLKCYI